jgi:hypothetical protein
MYASRLKKRRIENTAILAVNPRHSNIAAQVIGYLSLIILFNTQIRSIGQINVVSDISLYPRFWLSDIGLFLPIIYLKIRRQKLFTRPILKAVLIVGSYGLVVAITRNNPLYSMGHDIRTIIGLFSGFATIWILMDIDNDILRTIIHIELILALAATAITMSLPGAGQVASYERLTHPSAFILSDVPLILFSMTIIYASAVGKKVLMVESWACAILLFVNAAIITQTRSMAVAVSVGIFAASITIYLNSGASRNRRKYFTLNSAILALVILCGLYISFTKSLNIDSFIGRLQSGIRYFNDIGVKTRLDELPAVFDNMTVQQHIFGMGLNPPSDLTDYQGYDYNNLHIGIFNIWWRFGIIIFIVINILIIRALLKWIITLLKENKRKIGSLAIIICAPSLLVAYTIALTSGGWSPSFTYGVGIALGVYSKISRQAS